jgi:hypothetical protein
VSFLSLEIEAVFSHSLTVYSAAGVETSGESYNSVVAVAVKILVEETYNGHSLGITYYCNTPMARSGSQGRVPFRYLLAIIAAIMMHVTVVAYIHRLSGLRHTEISIIQY